MKNHQLIMKQLQSYSNSISSSKLSSRNKLNNQTKMRSTAITRKSSPNKLLSHYNKYNNTHKYLRIIQANLQKNNSTSNDYNRHIITSIIFDEKKHCVSNFKNYLIWDESSEFLKRYYNVKEAIYRIPKISSYYEKYTLFSPIYFGLTFALAKMMNKFNKKKKRYLEYIENNEENNKKDVNDNVNGNSNTKKDSNNINKVIHSIVIKESLLRSKSHVSIIDNKMNDTIALSKIDNNINNTNISLNELIDKSTINIESKESLVKPNKILQERTAMTKNKISDNPLQIKLTKINLNSNNNNKNNHPPFLTQSKRNKPINYIPYISNSTKQTTNNSLIKHHNSNSANKPNTNTFRKLKGKDDIGLGLGLGFHTKMNFNVNFNINLNINIQNNKPNKKTKLVLTTQKNPLKRKLVIKDTNLLKLTYNNTISNTNNNSTTHRTEPNVILNKKRLLDYCNGNTNCYTERNKQQQAFKLSSKAHQTINSFISKKHNSPTIISNLKQQKTNKGIIEPKLKYKNQPLTMRDNRERELCSIELLAKLIHSQHKAIKHLKSQNSSKERKGVI